MTSQQHRTQIEKSCDPTNTHITISSDSPLLPLNMVMGQLQGQHQIDLTIPNSATIRVNGKCLSRWATATHSSQERRQQQQVSTDRDDDNSALGSTASDLDSPASGSSRGAKRRSPATPPNSKPPSRTCTSRSLEGSPKRANKRQKTHQTPNGDDPDNSSSFEVITPNQSDDESDLDDAIWVDARPVTIPTAAANQQTLMNTKLTTNPKPQSKEIGPSNSTNSNATKKRKKTLACPFDVRNPDKYHRLCSATTYQTMSSLLDHIETAHRTKDYCAMCSDTFESAAEAREHVIARTCELKPLVIEGVHPDRMVELEGWRLDQDVDRNWGDYDDGGEGESADGDVDKSVLDAQWREVWEIIFGDRQSGETECWV